MDNLKRYIFYNIKNRQFQISPGFPLLYHSHPLCSIDLMQISCVVDAPGINAAKSEDEDILNFGFVNGTGAFA